MKRKVGNFHLVTPHCYYEIFSSEYSELNQNVAAKSSLSSMGTHGRNVHEVGVLTEQSTLRRDIQPI